MPTAKIPFDKYGDLKSRKFTAAEWDELHKRVRRELSALYRRDDVDGDVPLAVEIVEAGAARLQD
jgi:hypothetical protein